MTGAARRGCPPELSTVPSSSCGGDGDGGGGDGDGGGGDAEGVGADVLLGAAEDAASMLGAAEGVLLGVTAIVTTAEVMMIPPEVKRRNCPCMTEARASRTSRAVLIFVMHDMNVLRNRILALKRPAAGNEAAPQDSCRASPATIITPPCNDNYCSPGNNCFAGK